MIPSFEDSSNTYPRQKLDKLVRVAEEFAELLSRSPRPPCPLPRMSVLGASGRGSPEGISVYPDPDNLFDIKVGDPKRTEHLSAYAMKESTGNESAGGS
jgi:hypothetical protein